MISIGLTGNVGSGKSTVAAIWKAERGAVVIDADKIGRSVVQPGSRCLAALVERFGEEILLPDGSLNRRKMAEIAFSDTESREALNSIIHPEIIREINGQLRGARSQGLFRDIGVRGRNCRDFLSHEPHSVHGKGILIGRIPRCLDKAVLHTRRVFSRNDRLDSRKPFSIGRIYM